MAEPTDAKPSALIVVDVQRDFCEGGSLAVAGGADVASRISDLLAGDHPYAAVLATRDHHIDPGDHFSPAPDFVDSWPAHCVVGTAGVEFHDRLTFRDFDAVFDTGAYAGWGPTVANRVPVHATGPYRVAAVHARARAIHTHGPVAGAFRGFGVPQAAVAQEALIDRLADAARIDRLEFRLRNALRDGDATATGQVLGE